MAAGSDRHKPGLLFLSSPRGGLAHYVAHLWEPVSQRTRPLLVTHREPESDELLRGHAQPVLPVMDASDSDTMSEVVRLARDHGVRFANLHSGSRAKRHYPYFVELMERLGALGIRRVLHMHDADVHRVSDDGNVAIAELVRVSDAVLTGSRTESALLRDSLDLGERTVGLMRHGPYHMLAGDRFDRGSAREHLGLAPADRVILLFGYLRPEKRPGDLFDAYALVKERLPSSRLLVRCNLEYDPARRAWLEARARETGADLRVGYSSLDDVEAAFRAADVVALPYADTAASGVLNLARAFARPVVITDAFEHAQDIDATCGLAVPACEPRMLADALLQYLSSPTPPTDELARSWQRALPDEQWSDAADALLQACGLSTGSRAA